jgi:uncharacterized iron-regulated membrane protein
LIGEFIFSMVVLFTLVLGVVWLLLLFVKIDTWKHDENYIWNQPNHAADHSHAAPGAADRHAGHTHGA